jgi:hypothetical protein
MGYVAFQFGNMQSQLLFPVFGSLGAALVLNVLSSNRAWQQLPEIYVAA